MQERVGIVGVGYEGFRSAIADLSTRELMFEAASKAYADADLDPRKDVGSFICCTEDFWEGWSITDEMVPDQVGGARRPVCTVPADGIIGIGHAVMQIRAGVAEVVSVEAHSKVADVVDKVSVENMALDPSIRALGINNDVLAGLEMSGFLSRSGFRREDCTEVVVREKKASLRNERACYGAKLSDQEVEGSEPIAPPLMSLDRAEFAEAGLVFVLASEGWIRKNKRDAIYIDGVAWRSSTPWYEGGEISAARYARESYLAAAKQAGMRSIKSIDLMEVDDRYSYKLLQHLASLGFGKRETLSILEGNGPAVNASGGSLGVGYLIEASGLHRMLECVLQLRGEAGGVQVKGVSRALALSWRGNPTATGAVVILSR